MAKKNFKDVTGIKFADLIMPLVMGGIGSYSPAAGRGVGLGLQAFRTFQAGQAFSDEREEKKSYKEWAEQQVQQAEQRVEDERQGKIDPSEVAYQGSEGARGPATPVGGKEVENTPLGKGRVSLFGDKDATMTTAPGEFDLDPGGELPEAFGGSGQEMLTQAILGRKRAQDAAARDLGPAEEKLRFSQSLQFMEPNTGGYMSAQDAQREMSEISRLNFLNEQAAKWSTSAADKHRYTVNEINLRAGNQEHLMRIADELDGQFTSHNTSEGVVLHDKKAKDKDKALIFPNQNKRGGWQELMQLPLDDKIKLYNSSLAKYMGAVALSQESGEEFDHDTVRESREMLKQLWIAMQDTEDLVMIDQENAQRAAVGMKPITSLRELDNLFGVGPDGQFRGGRAMKKNKFIIDKPE
jgi:hypothetical protein